MQAFYMSVIGYTLVGPSLKVPFIKFEWVAYLKKLEDRLVSYIGCKPKSLPSFHESDYLSTYNILISTWLPFRN